MYVEQVWPKLKANGHPLKLNLLQFTPTSQIKVIGINS